VDDAEDLSVNIEGVEPVESSFVKKVNRSFADFQGDMTAEADVKTLIADAIVGADDEGFDDDLELDEDDDLEDDLDDELDDDEIDDDLELDDGTTEEGGVAVTLGPIDDDDEAYED